MTVSVEHNGTPSRKARPSQGLRPVTTGREVTFGDDEIIVSKTDLQGRITYANRVFLRVSGFTEDEVVGRPHSFIRHPDMPRCVFKLLWDHIGRGEEIFAYVVNLTKNGDHYWVFAHVTPTRDAEGRIVGYHSNRRRPAPGQIARVVPLYAKLLAEEQGHARKSDAIEASSRLLTALIADAGHDSYEQFVFAL